MNKNNRCRHSVYAKFDSDQNCPICSAHIDDVRTVDDGWAHEYKCTGCNTVLKKTASVQGCDPYLEIVELDNGTLALKFEGIDSWHRPVFKAIGVPMYFGSIDHLFDHTVPEEDIIAFFEGDLADNLVFFGNKFDCEPMGTSLEMFIVVIV